MIQKRNLTGPRFVCAPSRLFRVFGEFKAASWSVCALLATLCFGQNGFADVKLPALFSDNMVLQQKMRVPVWGWADDGEEVTVQFRGRKVTTTAKDGKWMVRLGNLKAGGPDDLTVSGKNNVVLKKVLVGEVWIASGQSNMEWPLHRSFEPQADIAASANPLIRLFTVPKLKADRPVDDVKASWQECNSETVTNFSAVAYYFGRALQRSSAVPVGLIHTSWGGSPAEVWMSQEVLELNPEYKKAILDGYSAALKNYQEALAKFEDEQAQLKKQGQTSDKKPPQKPSWKPAELYNGMIAPLLPFAIKGAIWYQGESNAGRAHQYRTLFADMIKNWRHDWRQGDFTFLEVQLAPWDKGKKRSFEAITAAPGDSDWAELREAQVLATKALPKVGMAVITDVGDKDDIHPTKKRPVGERLALAARRIAYGEKIVASGPTYKSMKVKGNEAVLTFENVGGGLAVGSPQGLHGDAIISASFSPDGRLLATTDGQMVRLWDVATQRVATTNDSQTVRVWDAATGRLLATNVDKTAQVWDLAGGNSSNLAIASLTGFSICGEDRKFVWAKAEIEGNKVVVSSPEVEKPVAVRYGWADYPVVNLWNKDGLPASPFRTDDFPMITQPKK
jgi:sialate O-acetylesterase